MPDRGELVYLALLGAYVLGAVFISRFLWRATRHEAFKPARRFLTRTTALALLFAPTLFVCGASAPLPFPMLIASDLFLPDYGCSPNHYLIWWNAAFIVTPTWVLIGVTLGVTGAMKRRASSNYRMERP